MLEQMPGRLLRLMTQSAVELGAFDDLHWHASRGDGKWTSLELLGHLIDSAANNHQRFVRALAQQRLDWPGYDQLAHVSVQSYAESDPAVCLALFLAYNRHLSHVIGQINAAQARTPCVIDGASQMTLGELALDYIAHLEHHLKQLLPGRQLQYSGMPWPPADPARDWPV